MRISYLRCILDEYVYLLHETFLNEGIAQQVTSEAGSILISACLYLK